MTPSSPRKTILLVGASRGLGFALAEDYLRRGWRVIATGRAHSLERLHALADMSAGALEVMTLDITDPAGIADLDARLAPRRLDTLFVNAGTKNADWEGIADVSTEEFVRVMVTNALSPLRVIEALHACVWPTGTIGVMSSGQGSLTNNTNGQYEVYRGSKAALNMFMRSFAARHKDEARTLLLMAPGWVRTDMGGPEARLTIAESIPRLVDTMLAHEGMPGLHYLDYLGRTVPW
ncbi:SDR family NAD(P)-dependent oxidoreductase [Xanthomonas sp. NCPPB 2632]|uniref:SDR family NAD(P)-dependent oxidoreductase n=1 Tax=Xanthomonas sp. NCPPB 2632 TaxID=3240912 RepID=UPI0035119596